MKAIQTKTTNTVYTLEGCNDLPATKYVFEDTKEEGVETCWELTAEEVERIGETGKIYLNILGNRVPPVLITTESVVKDGEHDDAE